MKKNDLYDKNKIYCDCSTKYYGQYIFDLEMPQNVVQQVQKPSYNYIFEDEFQFNQPFLYHQKLLNSILDIIKETEGKSSFFKNILLKYIPCDYLLFFLQKEDYFIQEHNKNKLVLLLKKPLCQIFLILYADQQNLQNYQKQILESSHTKRFLNKEIKKMSIHLDKLSGSMSNVNKPAIKLNFQQSQNLYNYQIYNQQNNYANNSDKYSYKARNEGLEEFEYDQSYYEMIVYENRLYQTLCQKVENSEIDYIKWLLEYSLPVINFIFKINSKSNNQLFEEERKKLEELLKKHRIEDLIQKISNFQSSNIIQKTLLETKKYIFQKDQGSNLRSQTSALSSKSSQLQFQISTNQFDGDLEQYVSLPLQNILSSKGSSLVQDKYTKIFLLNMLIMDEMKQIINLEKRSFIQALQRIDKVLNDEKSQKISTIFPRFTQFLRISFNQYSITKGWNEYRVLVDIMRTMILLLDNPLDSEETKKVNESKQVNKNERQSYLDNEIQKKREKYQELFANYNLPKYLMEMLCNKEIDYKLHHQSIKLRRTIFSLLNALLQGGNLKIQNQINQFFVQNSNSQLFFDMVSDMIDEEIKKTLSVSIYDEIEQDLETIEFVYRSKDKFLGISEVLKTIQLLCLGQFKKNQNYIRQQTNSRNSINLIEKISDLFDIVIRNQNIPDQLKIDISSLRKAIQILDTLIESIQGPVYENQIELIQSKILKSIADILQQEEDIEYMKFKKKQNPKGKSKISSEQQKKNSKLNDSKQEIQVKLIDNLKNLSKKFSEKVASKFFKTNEDWMVSKLKNKCIQFLESLLEGNQDSFILNKIMNDIPQQILSENLGIVFGKLKKYNKNKADIKLSNKLFKLSFVKIEEILQNHVDQREKYGIIVDTGFRVYHLLVLYYQENKDNNLKSLNYNQDIENQEEFQYQNYILQGYEYFKKYSLHIEVNIDNKFYQIYFPKLPACCIDYAQIIKAYEEKYDRLSTKTKTKDLIKYSQEIIIKLEHEYKINYSDQEKLAEEDDEQVEDDNVLLQAYSKIYLQWDKLIKLIKNIIVKTSYDFQTFSFRLAMFQNIIILFSFKSFHQFVTLKWGLAKESTNDDYYDDQDSTPFKDLSFIGINLNPVGFFVNFLAVIQILQVILNSFVFLSLILRDFSFYDNKIENKYIHQELKIHKYINYINLILRNKLDKQIKIIQLNAEKVIEFVFEKWVDLGLIICAFFALFNPVVTAILLLDIFRRIPSLKNILQSLIIARLQLFLTFILFLVLTYIFAILVYYFFWDILANQCFTLWTCFLFIFDMTFKNNAGYTSSYPPDYTDNWRIGTLNFQQLSYTFIIVIILGEIISGIIIDTLAKLREQDAAKNQDMQTICFICGQKRDYLDRKPGGWDQHVNEDHNRMNYIFFIMYLKFKSKTELSGFENLIQQQIDKQQINWFPILDFIAEQDGLEEKVQIEKKKQDLKFQEDQIYVDYKEFNEKNIKENVATQLDSITQKMEVIRKGVDDIVIPNSDSD